MITAGRKLQGQLFLSATLAADSLMSSSNISLSREGKTRLGPVYADGGPASGKGLKNLTPCTPEPDGLFLFPDHLLDLQALPYFPS